MQFRNSMHHTFVYLCISFVLTHNTIINQPNVDTLEIRAYVTSLDVTHQCLEKLGAILKGSYACTDCIYSISREFDLDQEFIRLRIYDLTEWKQKKICLTHKRSRKTIHFREFESLDKAQEHVKHYHPVCSFYRKGCEYHLNNMQIIVDEIEGLNPSVEILGKSRTDIDNLFQQLPVEEIVQHSVPYLVHAKAKAN